MNIKWSEAPRSTIWGDGMQVADIELSKDETLTLFCTEEGVPLVDGALRSIESVIARDAALEEAAKACESRYMGDNTREDMEAKRCAAAIRDLKALVPQPLTQEQAVVIAKQCATELKKSHEYLAHAVDDPNWMPHDWVIEAILRAANR